MKINSFWSTLAKELEYYFFILVIKALCVPAVNKVSGYCIKSLTALANKPPTMQIFPHSKFGINRSTGLKVMTKKFIFVQNNFLAITFKPVDRLIPNFECVKICMVGGLFANALKPLSQYPGTLFTAGTKRAFMTRIKK